MNIYSMLLSVDGKTFRVARRKIYFISSLLLIILGCGNKPVPVKFPPGFDYKYKFDQSEYQRFLQNRFDTENNTYKIPSASFEYFDTLKYFYSLRSFQPAYIKSFDDKFFMDSLLTVLGKSAEHGISPNRYKVNLIKSEYEKLIDSTVANNSIRYTHLANIELLLSDAILKYAYHMRYGVVDPLKIFPDSYFLPVVDSTKREILKPLNTENVLQYLHDIQPKSERYKKLQAALPVFTGLQNKEWKTIPLLSKKLRVGERTFELKPVIERLALLGFVDTSKVFDKTFTTFDSLIVKAVANFQIANGLIDDGTIGKATIEKLNVSPKAYVEKIKLSLERFRWTNYIDSSRYILVNIPDFHLRVLENKQEKFKIRVCTGNKRPANYDARLAVYERTKNWRNKPNDWETPQLYGRITHLILNPTWTVPTSIIRDEIYRKSVKDSLYLRKERFKVMYKGEEISLDEVNLKRFSPNKVPYIFVQDPGAGNALGRIKFMFTNKFDIYLHDTPTRAPFSAANRAVSHGCVRVEKPLLLADYVLNENSKWEPDYVRLEIGSPATDKSKISEYWAKRTELRKNFSFGKTTQVNLEHSIPLFTDYYTAWVSEDGIVNFREDVYGKDKILKQYLFSSTEIINGF